MFKASAKILREYRKYFLPPTHRRMTFSLVSARFFSTLNQLYKSRESSKTFHSVIKMPNQPVNIESFDKNAFHEWLNSFDVVLSDCDGVLWLHDQLYEGTNTVINKLVEMGKSVYLITNNSQTTREDMVEKCKKMNFNVDVDNVISSTHATVMYMKQIGFDKKAYIIGPKVLDKELQAAGIACIGVGPDIVEHPLPVQVMKQVKQMDKDVGAVIIGFDEHFSFPKLFKAINYLKNPEVLFIATNNDEKIEFPSFVFPDAGPIIAAIENVTGRKATIIGKPSKVLAEIALKKESHIDSKRFLMIGDRLNTDCLFGKFNNFQTLLVGTGCHTLADVNEHLEKLEKGEGDENTENHIPDFYISSFARLLDNA